MLLLLLAAADVAIARRHLMVCALGREDSLPNSGMHIHENLMAFGSCAWAYDGYDLATYLHRNNDVFINCGYIAMDVCVYMKKIVCVCVCVYVAENVV